MVSGFTLVEGGCQSDSAVEVVSFVKFWIEG